ncbi:MAG: hypothetical protein NVS9B4_04780 [Candidatus Acidiferrum sp.]
MKRSEAARYARWSAATAALLAVITVTVYLQHGWSARINGKKAPPPAPANVERQSNGLTFSKVEGERKVFTVEASKATEFRGKDDSLLQGVQITIFGKNGTRHDMIHTQSCQYSKASGSIECTGEVSMDLQSAADAEIVAKNPQSAAAHTLHVETRAVTFNHDSGLAQTKEQVRFTFPGGSGDALGTTYDSDAGVVRLLQNVRLDVIPPNGEASQKNKKRQSVHVVGSSLEFTRETRVLHLFGPAQAQTDSERLTAGEFMLELDEAFHAKTVQAIPGVVGVRPQLASQTSGGSFELHANSFTGYFAAAGWLTQITAMGQVRGKRASALQDEDFTADEAVMDVWPKMSQPRLLNLKGNVAINTLGKKDSAARALSTAALRISFAAGPGEQKAKPKDIETLGAGHLEWTEAATRSDRGAAQGFNSQTKLDADKLAMSFDAAGIAQQVSASGNVRTDREMSGKPSQMATAKTAVARLLPNGGWSQVDLQGDVTLKAGDRVGQADQVVFAQPSQSVTMIGRALVRDATMQTSASRIVFVQSTGEIRAEGAVRSTDLSPGRSAVQLAPAPANISADTMHANSNNRRATYQGHGRLWQGDTVLQADAIELLQDAKVLNASGNVRAVFPQTATLAGKSASLSSNATSQPSPAMASQGALRAAPKQPSLWHVSAGSLTYRDAESRAHLEQDVTVQSSEERLRAAAADLYFTKGAKSTNSDAGGQQISRAVATGSVVVQQGERKATAERAEYTAADGKFVMSGGTPTLFDGTQGTTTGRQLTFFLANDTIIVDSENGARVLTKHRVEK